MPGFKSNQMRKFLYASDKDKAQGQDPNQIHAQKSPSMNIPAQKSAPMSLPTSHSPQMNGAPQSFGLGTLGPAPKFHPTGIGSINPTANPSLHLPKPGSPNPTSVPALPGMPRFAKTRRFLK